MTLLLLTPGTPIECRGPACCVAVRDGAGAVRVVGAGAASLGPWSGATGAAAAQRHHADTGAAGAGRFDPDLLSPTDAVLHVRESARLRHARSEERRVGKECRSRWSPY